MNTTQSHPSDKQVVARKRLAHLYSTSPLTEDQMLRSLGLFMRSSCLAKLLYINELYQEIIGIPGIIMEFGVGEGQNQVLFNNLRAIYEPYNYTRLVVGFDYFPAPMDEYLNELLEYHESENVLDHIPKFELVKGDINMTLHQWLKNNANLAALVYLDVPNLATLTTILDLIYPRLIPGTIVAFDELNNREYPDETIAYLNNFESLHSHTLHKSRYLPDRCYARVI